MRCALVGIVVVLLACGPKMYSAPAPPDAMECAYQEAVNLGYERTDGAVEEDYARFERTNTAGLVAGRRTDNLTIFYTGDVLRFEANGFDATGQQMGPSGDVQREVQEILDRCARGATED